MTKYLEILTDLIDQTNKRIRAHNIPLSLKLNIKITKTLEMVFIKVELQRDELIDMKEERCIQTMNYNTSVKNEIIERMALHILTGFILRKSQYLADKESGKIIS